MIVIQLVHYIFVFYTMLLIVRILGSWIPALSEHPIMNFVASYADPYLNVFRRIIPPLGMIDISPLIAFIALRLLERYIALPFIIILLR
jgi:YggT family protein